MNELYFAMREWWSGFVNKTTEPNTFIPALLETEISRADDGTPINVSFPYIIYEYSGLPFGQGRIFSANIYSRILGNPGFIAPVLHVLEQFEVRTKDNLQIVRTSNGIILLEYVSAQVFPVGDPDDKFITRGLMQYQIHDMRITR